jgi:hypothetical protein
MLQQGERVTKRQKLDQWEKDRSRLTGLHLPEQTIQKRVIRAWIPTRIYVKMVILRTVLAKEVAVFSALEK